MSSRRQAFIDDFYNRFGYHPDEETISINVGEEDDYYHERRPEPRHQRTRYYEDDGAAQLLDEIKEITDGIASNALTAYRNRDAIVEAHPYISTFGYMLLIFLCKSSLFFLYKDSYSRGMDLSNV